MAKRGISFVLKIIGTFFFYSAKSGSLALKNKKHYLLKIHRSRDLEMTMREPSSEKKHFMKYSFFLFLLRFLFDVLVYLMLLFIIIYSHFLLAIILLCIFIFLSMLYLLYI